ncbi:hypothetical protein CUR178_08507 [Leishmania enriettii]|uniref:PLAC8 family protein n=1 Tax=Leishmania enriettii TaxID=5663 RepID=A0A836HZU7_LEIEN|nr:hypothetical protein CUR178_08507 [Leishmania enriettii]
MSMHKPQEAGGASKNMATLHSLSSLRPCRAPVDSGPLPLPSPYQQKRHQLQTMVHVPPSDEVQGVPILYRQTDGTDTPAPLIDELRRSAFYPSTPNSTVSSARRGRSSIGTVGSDVALPSLPGSAAGSMSASYVCAPAPYRLPTLQREEAPSVDHSSGDNSAKVSPQRQQGGIGDISLNASVVKPIFNLSRSSQYEVHPPPQPYTPYQYQQQQLLPPYAFSPFQTAPPVLIPAGPPPVQYHHPYAPVASYVAISSSPGSGHLGDLTYQAQQLENAVGEEEEPSSPNWYTGLFGLATDVPSAMDSVMCVYCISSAHFNYVYRQQRGMFSPIIAVLLSFDLCWCLQLWPVVTPLSSVTLHTFLIRRELRKRYGLIGNDLFVKRDSYNAGTAAATAEEGTEALAGEETMARAPEEATSQPHTMRTSGVTEETAATEPAGTEEAAAVAPVSPLVTARSDVAGSCAEGSDMVATYVTPCATWYAKVKLSDYWENIVLDGLISCFCVPCAVAQHHREMSIRGDWPGNAVVSRGDFTAREQHVQLGGHPQHGGTTTPIASMVPSIIPVTGCVGGGVSLTNMA